MHIGYPDIARVHKPHRPPPSFQISLVLPLRFFLIKSFAFPHQTFSSAHVYRHYTIQGLSWPYHPRLIMTILSKVILSHPPRRPSLLSNSCCRHWPRSSWASHRLQQQITKNTNLIISNCFLQPSQREPNKRPYSHEVFLHIIATLLPAWLILDHSF